MAKLSNTQIERFAVAAVRNEAIRPSSYLKPEILEGDKGVSFDGELTVFIDGTEKIESFIGKVPVQVKGKQVEEFTLENRTFSLSLKHYQNYYRNNGVLLLVVEVKDDGSSKIFYRQLLPKELSDILNFYGIKKKQGSKSVELRPIEETSLYIVCRKFINEQKNQPITLIENNPFTLDSFSQYNVTSLTFNPTNDATGNMFDHDFIIYGVKETLKVPLQIGRFHSISTTQTESFTLEGKTYNFKCKTTIQEECINRIIEDVFELSFNKSSQTFHMRILQFHSLTSQLKVLPFVEGFYSSGTLTLPEGEIELDGSISVLPQIEIVRDLYTIMQDIQKVFMELNIPENTIIKEIDPLENIEEGLKFITRALLYNDTARLTLDKPELACLVNYKIGDLLLILFYDPNVPMKLVNAFSPHLIESRVQIKPNEEFYPHSFYCQLNIDSLVYGANINYELIMASFDHFDPFMNEDVQSMTINFCLLCIKAFDISKKSELLKLAHYILNKYSESLTYDANSVNAAIVIINQFQIRLRESGGLFEEDIEKLIDIKTCFSTTDNIEIHFCTNVLLESKREAELSFSKMDEGKQGFYKTLPIYYLFSNLLSK